MNNPNLFDAPRGLTVDLFAGGGGASSGIEWATGRSPDIAINHDAQAVSLHKANHPLTKHYVSDVYTVDPIQATKGQPVALLWASPDCTHHSKARGAAPNRDKKRRALAWVVTRWAGQVRPSVIMLENVMEFADWGPLIGPVGNRQPCPRRKGKTSSLTRARRNRGASSTSDTRRAGRSRRRRWRGSHGASGSSWSRIPSRS
jgi:DNA (cytosine-5)-methyltransferase 1